MLSFLLKSEILNDPVLEFSYMDVVQPQWDPCWFVTVWVHKLEVLIRYIGEKQK